MVRKLVSYFRIAALVAAIFFCMPVAEGCFIAKDSLENPRSEWAKERYDSSNWEREDNIYNPKNFDFCRATGWC